MPRQSKAPVRQFSFVKSSPAEHVFTRSRPSEARPDGTAAADLPDRDRVERRLAKRPSVWGFCVRSAKTSAPSVPACHRCRALAKLAHPE